MKLPTHLLDHVRGPGLVLVLAGCTSPVAPVPIVPEPTVPVPVVVAAADPVSYDEADEAARLGALDGDDAEIAARRNRRIAVNVAAARVRARPSPGIGSIGPGWPGGIAPNCGRG